MATVTREIIEERWACQTRDVQRFVNESGIRTVNSDRWTEVDEGLEDLAAFLVEEASQDELTPLTEGLWDVIRERMIEWALEVEARRAGKAAAA